MTVGLGLVACSQPATPAAPAAATTAPKPAAGATTALAAPAGAVATAAPKVQTTASGGYETYLAASANAATEEQLYEAAKREGKVVMYASAVSMAKEEVVNAFQKKYPGIAFDAQRIVTAQVNQKMIAENEAKNVLVDMIGNTDMAFMSDANAKGWMMTVNDVPALKEFPKQHWRDFYGLVSYQGQGICWNTQLVPEGLKDWPDLLNPKFKDNMLMSDPRTGGTGRATWVTFNDLYGPSFMEKIVAQNPRIVDSTVVGAQQIAAGAAMVYFTVTHTSVAPMIDAKAPIADVIPDKTNFVGTYFGLAKAAPHPNAARLLLNFMLSKEGQGIINTEASSPIPNVPGTLPGPKEMIEPKFEEGERQKDAILKGLKLA
jgi:iron(III) transport system substrate-binding protein